MSNNNAKAVVTGKLQNKLIKFISCMEHLFRKCSSNQIPIISNGIFRNREYLQSQIHDRIRNMNQIFAISYIM